MDSRGDRKDHTTLAEALAARGTPAGDRAAVEAVAAVAEAQLGPIHDIYVGQGGLVVGMSFGPSDLVDVYASPGVVAIAAEALAALGGLEGLTTLMPGFTAGSGSRSDEAKLELPSRRTTTARVVPTPVPNHGVHCGVVQPIGTECHYCGEVVPRAPRSEPTE